MPSKSGVDLSRFALGGLGGGERFPASFKGNWFTQLNAGQMLDTEYFFMLSILPKEGAENLVIDCDGKTCFSGHRSNLIHKSPIASGASLTTGPLFLANCHIGTGWQFPCPDSASLYISSSKDSFINPFGLPDKEKIYYLASISRKYNSNFAMAFHASCLRCSRPESAS